MLIPIGEKQTQQWERLENANFLLPRTLRQNEGPVHTIILAYKITAK